MQNLNKYYLQLYTAVLFVYIACKFILSKKDGPLEQF